MAYVKGMLRRIPFLFALILGLATSVAQAEQRVGLKVVELFTSQGCSSCPPADALLADFADRDDLLALAFHVDYWNYLGWEDPLSAPFAAERQAAYRTSLNLAYVYTPQFIVGGATQFGLRTQELLLKKLDTVPLRGVDMAWQDGQLVIRPMQGGLTEARVWIVHYQHSHEAMISAGENRGRSFTYRHAVTEIQEWGAWDGTEMTLVLPDHQDHGMAILVTNAKGIVYGAADWTRE